MTLISPRYLTFKVIRAMGHSAESAFALWATAQNLLKSYGPQRRIWLSPVGHCAEFRSALWAMAQNQLPQRRAQQIHWKVCHNLWRNSKAKSLHLYNALPKAYPIHAWNPSQPRIKNWFCAVGHYAEWYSNSNVSAKSKLNSKWL